MLENILYFIDYKKDMQNTLDTAVYDNLIGVVKQMKLYNETIEKIMLYSGLSEEQINQIKP